MRTGDEYEREAEPDRRASDADAGTAAGGTQRRINSRRPRLNWLSSGVATALSPRAGNLHSS